MLRDSSGFSHKHAEKSAKAVRAFLAHSGGELTRPAGRAWLTALGKAGSRKTAANKMSALRMFGEWLEGDGHIERNPWQGIVVARGFRSPGWAPFTAAEVTRLIEAAEAREGTAHRGTNTGPLCSTWYALLTLTGLRYSECRGLMWKHVDLEARTLTVRNDKARRGDILPLSTEAVAALRLWRAYWLAREWSRGDAPKRKKLGFIFPQAPSHHSLEADMRAAGLVKNTENTGQWHRFRKAAIAERAAAGASVRDLYHFARHSDPKTTLEIYDRATVSQLRGVAELMPTLNGFLEKSVDMGPDPVETDGVKANKGSLMPNSEQPTPAPATASRGLDNRAICAGVGVGRSRPARTNGAGGNLPSGLDALIAAHCELVRLVSGAHQ